MNLNQRMTDVRIDEGVASMFGMQTSAIYAKIDEMNGVGRRPCVADLCSRFPYLTVNQVKHSLRTLETNGLVESEQPGMTKLQMAKVYETVKNNG